MSIRVPPKGIKSKSGRVFGHLRVVGPEDPPEPLLKHHCRTCLDTGLDLSITTDRMVKAYPCSKCAPSDDRPRWNEKLVQADHINKSKFSLNQKLKDVLTKCDFLLGDEGLPPELKGRIEDLFSNVSKPGPRTPVSQGELAAVAEMASQGKLWAGKLDKGETSCPHLISRIPAFFRPETRGRKIECQDGSLIRGSYGETILIRPHILTTVHQRIILALTHIHHQKGFGTDDTETSHKEILRAIRKSPGGKDVVWLKERLSEIEQCRLTAVNSLGGLFGTTTNAITTANQGEPIFTYQEHPKGVVVNWSTYYLTQYRRHLYSRISLDVVLSLPPVAQLIYVFLASHDNDASWMKVETWMKQLGLEYNFTTRQTFARALSALEDARVIHTGTVIERCVWILLTRGTNYDLPSMAPDSVKNHVLALIAAAKKPRLATEADVTPWGPHSQQRSAEKAELRAGASGKGAESKSAKLAEEIAEQMRKKAENIEGKF
jgi:hypothetical protein